MLNGAAVKESSTWVPQNLKTELQCDLAILLLGIYSKIIEVKVLKINLYSYVPSSIICNSQCRRNPTDEWINKMQYVHKVEYYLTLKKGNSHTCYNLNEV